MNKREEFEKALQDYDACNISIVGNKDWNEKRNKLRALFPAAQPSQDGLPELPTPAYPTHSMGPLWNAPQMHAYGAQCRAATPKGESAAISAVQIGKELVAITDNLLDTFWRIQESARRQLEDKDLPNGG